MIPNEDSYCEIDPTTVDQWGIPVLRFNFKWSQDELLQAKHMQETFKEIIETAGGTVTSSAGEDKQWGISRGGEIIHEVGATKIGDNPKTSVLNQYCQAWDVQESVHHRCRAVRQQCRQESDVDDYGARLADVRIHCRSGQKVQRKGVRRTAARRKPWQKTRNRSTS